MRMRPDLERKAMLTISPPNVCITTVNIKNKDKEKQGLILGLSPGHDERDEKDAATRKKKKRELRRVLRAAPTGLFSGVHVCPGYINRKDYSIFDHQPVIFM